MRTRSNPKHQRFQWSLVPVPALTLLACLFYAFVYAFVDPPYCGMSMDSQWVVTYIDSCDVHPGWCEADEERLRTLREGDRLVAIGDLTHDEYWDDMRLVAFAGYDPGDSVTIALTRDGQGQMVVWRMPPVTRANRLNRLVSGAFGFPFWLAGTAVFLLLRPRDRRWRLLVCFNYLTAFWLVVGIVSSRQVAASALVVRAVSWLMVPIYLDLHLLVPTPVLGRGRRYVVPALYAMAVILAALEMLQLLPRSAYFLGLLVAIVGSLGLLVSHLFGRSSPSDRLAARLMLTGIGIAFGPGIILWLVPALLDIPGPGDLYITVATLSIPALPLFYIYAIFKRYLGDLEFRTNRLVGLYSFALLYVTGFIVVFQLGSQWPAVSSDPMAFGLAISMLFVIPAQTLRARFQKLIDRLSYGHALDPAEILGTFASRIASALDHRSLAYVLAEEVAPSLLVHQSALCLMLDGDVSVIYARDVDESETPRTSEQVHQLLLDAARYRAPVDGPENGFDWVRLAIPLETREKMVGVWLFGRRDPDDYYPRTDVALLTSLASQVAVAAENAQLYNKAQQEITQRSRAESALRQSEEKYRSVVENANEAILVIQDGRLVFANPRATQITGCSSSELTTRTLENLVHPDDRQMVADLLANTLNGEQLPDFQAYRLLGKEDAVVWVEMNAVRIAWEGKPAILTFLSDVTQRKHLEDQFRQAQKMESVGRLAGGIAHDFNNLLTAINGFASLLELELPPSDPKSEYVTAIRKAGERAAELTSQLLAFSRKQIIQPRVVSLNGVVRGMEQLLRRIIGEDVEMETVLESSLWPVMVDAAQMEQVIINLAVNARDAMPGGGRLTIETANVVFDDRFVMEHLGSRHGEHVLLAIRDTGVGMSKETKSHLFEPFFTTKEKGKGTGLGLATVYGIVKQNGGYVWCDSEEGHGTAFTIYLPRRREQLGTPVLRNEARKIEPGSETIMVVEDDQTVRDLAVRVLERAGYEVIKAAGAEAAMEQSRSHTGPIHLLLTDIVMPHISGSELAERLTQIRTDTKVLYMSGYTDDSIVHHGVLDPGTAFLQKPFSPWSLARRVRQVLDSV